MGNASWSAVGPAPQRNGNIAYSARMVSFAVSRDFNDAGIAAMFVATDGGGVWRATQYTGRAPTWNPLTDLVPNVAVGNRTGLLNTTSVTVHPHNPRVVFAGTGAGVLRSQDGGNTWTLLANSPGSATRIVVDARPNGTAVWAAGPFGLQLSANGLNWTPVTIGDFGFTSFSVDDLEWTLSGDQNTLTLFAAVHDTATNNDGTRNGIYVTKTLGGT